MFLYILIIMLLTPSVAYAYLDPGTGNIIINVLIGSLAAILFSIKKLFYYLLNNKKSGVTPSDNLSRIVIFGEGRQYWGTFKPIVNALIKNKRHFNYYTLDIEDPALLIENEYMSSKFLGYGSWAILKFNKIEGDILLSTTPNIGNPDYSFKRPERVKKMVHVFHSINDIAGYKKGSLDNYDKVIMAGDFQAESIREVEVYRNLPRKELVSLGLPYLDELAAEKKDFRKKNSAKTVLIGSSWGTKGCLQSYGTDFIKIIAGAGYHVIVRPHPQSVKTEQHILLQFKEELKNVKNIEWDETISPGKSMNIADILISDASAIKFDFAFLYEKPVITLDIKSDEMPGFERDDLSRQWSDTSNYDIGFVLQREKIGEIAEYINRALQEYNSSRISDMRDRTVKNFGMAGKVIADYLCDNAGLG